MLYSTALYPQLGGMVERMMNSVDRYLTKVVFDDLQDYDIFYLAVLDNHVIIISTIITSIIELPKIVIF